MLNVNNLSISYNGHFAVKGVTLNVEKGEIVALIGANGAGKSTLLNTIAGLTKPSNGSIYFKGKEINKIHAHEIVESGAVLVPQGRRLFPNMTVEENLSLGAFIPKARKNSEETKKLIFNLFPLIKERKKQVTKTLSGGEQQMLAIARGLMALPKLLMLDEPSLGLSPAMVTNIFRIMKEIHDNGVTIFLVEQNLHTTLSFSDRAYIIENGSITMEGISEQLSADEYVKKAYLGM